VPTRTSADELLATSQRSVSYVVIRDTAVARATSGNLENTSWHKVQIGESSRQRESFTLWLAVSSSVVSNRLQFTTLIISCS